LVNVGAQDESVLFAALDGLAGDPSVGPLALWTYGLDQGFLDFVLQRLPDAVIGLLSPWELLGWPHRTVSAEETYRAAQPIERLAARLRSGARGYLFLSVPRPFREQFPEIIERVRSERTTLMPSDGFYIWAPETPEGRAMDPGDQAARMEAMGDLSARMLLAEKTLPSLLDLYPMREDPPPEPAGEPPVPELEAFHRLVLDGWRQWRIPVPEPFEFEVHVVRWSDSHPGEAVMMPSLPALAEPHPVYDGCRIRFTETGVELRWEATLSPQSEDVSPRALAALPKGLARYAGTRSVEVLFVPTPPRIEGGTLRLRLRADPSGIAGRASWNG
jgi:hypothetical protein